MAKATRQAFGEALAELGGKHPQIVVLDADLAKSTKSEIFAKKYPDRFFEMGIQEANMIGAAAGMAFAGKLPFLCSFGCFITGRYDTIRLSVAYAGANVRLIGTHAGVGIGDDGHSQMGLEDITLMRALPTMGVFQPMDAKETSLIMDYLVNEWEGPAYLRLTRQALPDLLPAGADWKPGKLLEIRAAKSTGDRSRKVALIGSGHGTSECMKAAELLEAQGIPASVWNCHSLKPFDDVGLAKLAADCSLIVTVEDHSVIGGLGSCVAETLASLSTHPRLVKCGVQDLFGESGEPEELLEKHGITGTKVAERVRTLLAT